MPAKSRAAFSWRKLIQQIHLWIGLILCVPLVAIGLTGSILVFDHEIEDLLTPPPRPAGVGALRSIDDIAAAAQNAAPPGLAPTMVIAPAAPGEVASVRLAPWGRTAGPSGALQLLIDPVSLEILERREPGQSLVRQIFLLHANLLMRDRSGRGAVGWLGVVMLSLGISGLFLWWPRPNNWRAAFTVKRGARGVRFHRDLHGAVGIWSLVVFIVVSFSGVYLAFPQTLGSAIGSVLPARDLRSSAAAIRVVPIKDQAPTTIDEAVALARLSRPDTLLRFVGLPTRPNQPVRVGLARPGDEQGAPTITVFVDPWQRRVIEVRDPHDYTIGEKVMAWQRALHAGHGLGWLWRILVFLSGFLPLVFAITGIAMWLLKRRRRQASPAWTPGPAD